MADQINKRIALIEPAPPVPESIQFEDEDGLDGRKAVKNLRDITPDRIFDRAGQRCFRTAVRPPFAFFLFLGFTAAGAGALAQTMSTVPTVETIIERMVQAQTDNRAGFRPYIVTRDYRLFGKDRQSSKSQVIADVTFVPPGSKKYTIQRTEGTGLGVKIVRRMLEGEAEIAKEYRSTDISVANYDFRFVCAENLSGQLCYKLELLPLRKHQYLLRGNIWVDANTYLLRRSEGEPANKSPSWWLRNVRIELVYGDVNGMWLQTASDATVSVRIFGQYSMVTRDLEYKFEDLAAVGSAAQMRVSNINLSGSFGANETARGKDPIETPYTAFLQWKPRSPQWLSTFQGMHESSDRLSLLLFLLF